MNNEFARPYAYKRFPEQLGQHLGGGLFFSVFDKPGDPDTVVKVARRGRWSLSDLKGQRVYQRMAHDLFLVKRYLGEYLFDFTGSDLVYELLRFNFTGWSLPSLLVEDGRLKFADCNLYFSGKIGPKHPSDDRVLTGDELIAACLPIERYQLQAMNKITDMMIRRLKKSNHQ